MTEKAKQPKVTGEISEVNVLAQLTTLGFVCSKPYGDNAPYDLIVDTGDKLVKLQIKTVLRGKRALRMSFMRSRINTKGSYRKPYAKSDVDFFAAYDTLKNKVFIISNEGQGSFSLQETVPPKGRTSNMHMADDYLLTIDSFN